MAESYPHGFVAVTECSSIVGDCMQLVFQLPWVWFILYDSPPVDFFVIYESDLYGLYFFFFFWESYGLYLNNRCPETLIAL